MGYVFLVLALAAGATKGYCGKISSGFMKNPEDSWLISLVRMIFCVMIGFIFAVVQGGAASLKIDISTLLISVISGVSTALFVVTWIRSVQKGAYIMVDVFLMLGVIVPVLGCKIFFNEEIKMNQPIGFLLLLAATYVMCTYNMSIKGKMTVKSVIPLVLCGFFNGLTDFSQKLFLNSGSGSSIAVFNLYTYVFAAITLFAFYIPSAGKSTKEEKKSLLKQTFGYILVLSLCLFLYSYFKTKAAIDIPSAKLYPLSQGAALIISMVMSAMFFDEKITKKSVVGACIAFAALLIINLL